MINNYILSEGLDVDIGSSLKWPGGLFAYYGQVLSFNPNRGHSGLVA